MHDNFNLLPLFYEVRLLYLTEVLNTFGSLCFTRSVFCIWPKCQISLVSSVLRGPSSVFDHSVEYVWFPLFYEVRVLYLTKMSNTFGSLCRKRLVFCSWLKFSVIIWTFNEFRRDVIFGNWQVTLFWTELVYIRSSVCFSGSVMSRKKNLQPEKDVVSSLWCQMISYINLGLTFL